MYLAQVRIRNFRNLRDLTLGLSPGLNVLVGENNIGKTNVIDALRCALGPSSLGGAVPRLTRDDIHRAETGKRVDGPIRVDLTFKGLSAGEQAEFLECLNYNAEDPGASTASIHYEWTWSDLRNRGVHRRRGSDKTSSEASIPESCLEAIGVIFLDALRDALVALTPGRDSRLGNLLNTVAKDSDRERLEGIFLDANKKIEQDEDLIQPVEAEIEKALREASGTLGQRAGIRASDAKFHMIVNTLRLFVKVTVSADTTLYEDVKSNGLGYNNLLYIGTVLAELAASTGEALPMLLVEEPEAHLHPQLQVPLSDFLGRNTGDVVQTIVTTHSPTIASRVPPNVLRVLHRAEGNTPSCVAIGDCDLSDLELKRLRRMFDITKATLLFSRGVILVEGITEQILLPALAARMGVRLEGISIISLAGVSFSTIGKLFGAEKLGFPVAIVTDADPVVVYDDPAKPVWREANPERNDKGVITPGPRFEKLLDDFKENPVVHIYNSTVTLEYDLALVGDGNATTICSAWESLYERKPRSLSLEELEGLSTREERALELWRAICVGNPSHGKAEVAQALAERLEETGDDGEYVIKDFAVPEYLQAAIMHALSASGKEEEISPTDAKGNHERNQLVDTAPGSADSKASERNGDASDDEVSQLGTGADERGKEGQ